MTTSGDWTLREDDWRFELKAACEERAWPSILANLQQSGLALRRHHPDRYVQSVYFDTAWHDALRDNLAGISQRAKVRFRWYGKPADAVVGNLERKVRVGGVGTKDVARIPGPVGVRGCARHRFADEVVRTASGVRAWLDGREPVQWIRYHREYWCSFDGQVRVTADTGIQAFDLRARPDVSDACPSPLPRILIIETKASRDLWWRVQPIFQELGLRADRCSKFVMASVPGEGPRPFQWERTP